MDQRKAVEMSEIRLKEATVDMEAELLSKRAKIKELEALVKMMAEALEFYADKNSWEEGPHESSLDIINLSDLWLEDDVREGEFYRKDVGGLRARTCLEAYRKEIEK
jgi:hypothetical protein